MTDKKIGDLTAATTPLAGTELVELQTSTPASRRCSVQDIANLANPMTTAGDLIVGGTAGALSRLAKGADGKLLGMVAGAQAYVAPPLGSPVSALAIVSNVVNIDCSLGDYFTLALSDNVTTLSFSNLPASGTGRTLSVELTQDATGARTFALPASFKAITGSDVAIQAAALAVTKLFIETVDAGTAWSYSMKGRA